MRIANLPRYFLYVVCIFVGIGPLIPVFPGVASPMFLLVAWQMGALPALLAALYYFLFTAPWFLQNPTVKRRSVFLICGALGAVSGVLGILTFSQLSFLHSQLEQLFFSSSILSTTLGAIGGLGSALLAAFLWARAQKMVVPGRSECDAGASCER